MYVHVQPNQHLITEIRVGINSPETPDLIVLHVTEMDSNYSGQSALALNRKDWQDIATQLAGLGVTSDVTA